MGFTSVQVRGAGPGGEALPAGGQVHSVHQRQQRRVQLQLRQQREVVGGDVRVRAPCDVVVHQPLRVQRPQDSQHIHVSVGVENVVNHTLQREGRECSEGTALGCSLQPSSLTQGLISLGFPRGQGIGLLKMGAYFEVKSVIGVRHQVVLVGALELEAVRDPALRGSILPIATEVHETLVVAQLLEVLVVVSYNAIAQVFHHTCGQGEVFRELL